MEIEFSKGKIEIEKDLNELDKLTIDFTSILTKLKIRYVLISGYISILFGRSRSSPDIDVIIEKLSFPEFQKLWKELCRCFECINTTNAEDAYNNYLAKDARINFPRKGNVLPYMEVKFPTTELEKWALTEKIRVSLSGNEIFISPLELQISYKLFLGRKGNEKDIEDARHLYKLFSDKLDMKLLEEFNKKLKVVDMFNKYIR